MTRFCWWTLVWFGLSILSSAVQMHYMGGWAAFAAEYDLTIRASADATIIALWLVLWFRIVKKEPG